MDKTLAFPNRSMAAARMRSNLLPAQHESEGGPHKSFGICRRNHNLPLRQRHDDRFFRIGRKHSVVTERAAPEEAIQSEQSAVSENTYRAAQRVRVAPDVRQSANVDDREPQETPHQ